MQLKVRSDVHLARKIWHAAGVSLMAVIFAWLGPVWSWLPLGVVAVIIVPLDILRQRRPNLNAATLRVFGPLMRRHEEKHVSGLTYILIGTALLIALFDPYIVTLTLLFLAFGDPIASYCGIRYGKDRIIGNKTLQGTAGAFAACTVVAAIYYYAQNLMLDRIWIVAPLSGLIGAFAEAAPVGRLDDNFTFPLISGALLWVLFAIFAA